MGGIVTYSQAALVGAYVEAQREPYPHEDFAAFRRARLAALEAAFGVHISEDGVRSPNGRLLFVVFKSVVASYLRIRYSGDGVLEGGLLETAIDRADTPELGIRAKQSRIHSLLAQCAQEQADLLDSLFTAIWGNSERVVTSEDLVALGFDDTKEPRIEDYYDRI